MEIPWYIWTVGALLSFASASYVLRFVFPAWRVGRDLARAIRALGAIKARGGGRCVDIEAIGREAMVSPLLAHLWAEYVHTLHAQKGRDGRPVRWRATTLAETFFTEQAVVDYPLRAEFYKHLPGILTGLGIIGTFAGLIGGLIQFDVSLEPAVARAELGQLIHAVGHAFYVSAAAIGLAMLITWTEKALVSARYRQLQVLRQAIDDLFEAGAGEEYLERLANAAEASRNEVAELRRMLEGDLPAIVDVLSGGRAAPGRGDPALAIERLGERLSDALGNTLAETLSTFSAQTRTIQESQLRGMERLHGEIGEAMQTSTGRFSAAANSLESTSRNVVESLADHLDASLGSMERRQQNLNRQMSDLLERIGRLIDETQSETAKKTQDSLALIGRQAVQIVETLRAQVESSVETQRTHHAHFIAATDRAVDTLSAQMKALLAQAVETNQEMRDMLGKLSAATERSIARINMGAETLYYAAAEFAKAGQSVAGAMKYVGDKLDERQQAGD